MSSKLQIAIDGPSASGKSTVSREVAERLGFAYLDSGSLYRGVTWKALREGVDCKDADAVIALIDRIELESFIEDRLVRFRLDGVDPGPELRSDAVVERVSDVAAVPEVRGFVVDNLRKTSRFGNLVMEGRDIGTVVFPETGFKFYLDADPTERARRRHKEIAEERLEGDLDEVMESLQRRDRKDTTRKADPLQVADGARVINTTSLSIAQVVDGIVEEIRSAGVGV